MFIEEGGGEGGIRCPLKSYLISLPSFPLVIQSPCPLMHFFLLTGPLVCQIRVFHTASHSSHICVHSPECASFPPHSLSLSLYFFFLSILSFKVKRLLDILYTDGQTRLVVVYPSSFRFRGNASRFFSSFIFYFFLTLSLSLFLSLFLILSFFFVLSFKRLFFFKHRQVKYRITIVLFFLFILFFFFVC